MIFKRFRFTSLQETVKRSIVQNQPASKASKLLLISVPSRRVCLAAVTVPALLSFPY